jgi:hypothetical protein
MVVDRYLVDEMKICDLEDAVLDVLTSKEEKCLFITIPHAFPSSPCSVP